MKKLLKSAGTLLVLVVVAGTGFWLYRRYMPAGEVVKFRTETVERGKLENFISATGTVEPEELINVGAQVGGMITRFGLDAAGKSVDYGSQVTSGMVLANIDDSLYQAEVKSAEAQKLQAQASINSAEANLNQAKAELELARSNWVRAQELSPKGAIARSDFDVAQSEFRSAQAAIGVSEAAVELAKAQLAAAEAELERAQRNWEYCVISSPVDGIIIDRRVNVGQTVNSSMNAPSLFLIAKDLKRMQVWASVNEADIGAIQPGQPVKFTVDAFSGREFVGEVQKIRLNATMSQNVVTYVVEIGTDNSDGKLLPYLTANVKFIIAERDNVLYVPNAAFRVKPDPAQVPAAANPPEPGAGERLIWVRRGSEVVPVVVKTGLNDGSSTEIVAGDLQEGDEVVTGVTVVSAPEAASEGGESSPFLPKPPKRR